MIKIIQGTYGHCEGARIIPKTPADEPFEATPEREQRLVRLGVAVYVETELTVPEASAAKVAGSDNGENDGSLPEYNVDMKMDELKEIAQAYGVDASKARSKAEIIAIIDMAREGEVDEDGEIPPVFGAIPPVAQ